MKGRKRLADAETPVLSIWFSEQSAVRAALTSIRCSRVLQDGRKRLSSEAVRVASSGSPSKEAERLRESEVFLR